MQYPTNTIQLHQHARRVALSCDASPTVYLTSADARALARELVRFARSVDGTADAHHQWPVARVVENGKARNSSDGHSRPVYLGN